MTVLEQRGGEVPLLKLQLRTTIMPAIDFCFPMKINTHFPCGVGPIFLSSLRGTPQTPLPLP